MATGLTCRLFIFVIPTMVHVGIRPSVCEELKFLREDFAAERAAR